MNCARARRSSASRARTSASRAARSGRRASERSMTCSTATGRSEGRGTEARSATVSGMVGEIPTLSARLARASSTKPWACRTSNAARARSWMASSSSGRVASPRSSRASTAEATVRACSSETLAAVEPRAAGIEREEAARDRVGDLLVLAVEGEVGGDDLPAGRLDGGAPAPEVEEEPGELEPGRGADPSDGDGAVDGARPLDHARRAGGGHRAQRREPRALALAEPGRRRPRLLPRSASLRVEALGEVDEVGEAIGLVGVDLDVGVEAVDEGGEPRLLLGVGGSPRGGRRRRGGRVGVPRRRDRE